MREIIEEFKIVITWGWTYTMEENREILQPTVKIMLDINKEEQARRIWNDKEWNTRRWTKKDAELWCRLSHTERLIKEAADFHDEWSDFIRSRVDYVFTCSKEKSKYDMRDEIISTPEVQDILQYNG